MCMSGFYAVIRVDMPFVKRWEDAVVVSQELVDELVYDDLIDTNSIDMYVQKVVKDSPKNKCVYE